MATLEELVVEISSDTTGIDNGFNDVNRGVDQVSKKLKTFGSIVAAAFAGAAIVDFGSKALDAASDADELGNKYGVVFEGVTAVTNEWIANYTDATARGEEATKEYLTSLQDIRTGFGDTRENAAKFSQAVVGITNDLSSFSNVDFESASNAIQSGLSGQFEALRSLGVGINVAIIDQSEYAESINKTWKEMSNLEKQEAILNQIVQQSTNAVGQAVDTWQEYDFALGDAANTSEGFANQQKLLTQTLTDVAAEIGSTFLPAATEMISSIIEGLDNARPFIVATFQTLVDWIGAASDFIGPFVRVFTSGINTIISALGQLTGISQRATQNQIDDTQERIDALNKEKEDRINALKVQADAEKDHSSTVAKVSKEMLESRKDALKEELDEVKKTTDKIIDSRKEETEEAIEAIDEQLDALKDAQKERLKAIDEEFEAKLKLLDAETRERIELLEAQKQAINLEQEAVDAAENLRKQREKIAELEERIAKADTSEERKDAEKDLAEFQREIRLEEEEAARKAEIDALDESIKNIEAETDAKEDALKEEQEALEDQVKEETRLKTEALEESKELLKEELDEFIDVQKQKVEAVQDAYDDIKKAVSSANSEIATSVPEIPEISIEDQIEQIESEYDELIVLQEEKLNEFAEQGEGAISSFVSNAVEFFVTLASKITESTEGVVTTVLEFWNQFSDDVADLFSDLIGLFGDTFDLFEAISDAARKFWDEWGDDILSVATMVFESIFQVIDIAMELIRLTIQTVTALIEGDWEKVWENIKTIASTIVESIETLITTKFELIRASIELVLIGIQTFVESTFNAIFGILSTIMDDIFTFLVDKFNEINDFLLGISLFKVGADILTGLIDGIKSVADDLVDSIKEPIEEAVSGVKDFLGIRSPSRLFRGIGENVGEGFIDGVDRTADQANRSIEQLVSPDMGSVGQSNTVNNINRNPQVIIQQMNVNEQADIEQTAQRLFDLQESTDRSTGILPIGG